jgi:xylulokinase
MDYFLGIDIGPYSSKGMLVKETSEVVASRAVEHPLEMPHPGWAEHDAEATWWSDFLAIVRSPLQSSGVPASRIAGVGLSAISPAVLPIDREGRALRKELVRHRHARHSGNCRIPADH